jgi:hypothetical protein
MVKILDLLENASVAPESLLLEENLNRFNAIQVRDVREPSETDRTRMHSDGFNLRKPQSDYATRFATVQVDEVLAAML